MNGSLRLCSIAGIAISAHWTFVLVLVWLSVALTASNDIAAAAQTIALFVGLFGSVVLHELGHALVARQYGVKTLDITLLPIGGTARLSRIPEVPSQEMLIALAGPAVNFLLVGVLLTIRSLTADLLPGGVVAESLNSSFVSLMWTNLVLGTFNLLPAFPMDGGRVLRAILATQTDYVRATQIAASLAQGIALALALIGLFTNLVLLLVAGFVFFSAKAEAEQVQLRFLARGVRVRDAMMTRFVTMAADETLGAAADELIAGEQHDFPVTAGDALVGMLTRQDLLAGIARHGRAGRLQDAMRRPGTTVQDSDSLEGALAFLQRDTSSVPVLHAEKLVGLLSAENLQEWLTIRSVQTNAETSEIPGPPKSDSSFEEREQLPTWI